MMMISCILLNTAPALTNMRSDQYQPAGTPHWDVWLTSGSLKTPIGHQVCERQGLG